MAATNPERGGAGRDEWRVVEARFETSAPTLAAAPPADRPELAVAGRSNVGKSSLLNALCRRQGLARTSAAPGRTQLLNFFAWTLQGPGADAKGSAKLEVRCADLPGYGYAAVPTAVRDSFAPMIERYLLERASLRALLLLVDVRRGVDDRDVQLVEFLGDRPIDVLVVGTKGDKLSTGERGLWARQTAEALGVERSRVHLSSAKSGEGLFGRGGLLPALVARLRTEPP